MNGIVQVSTQLPDSHGAQSACINAKYGRWGSWIWTRLNNEYCGDMIWSGHMFHCFFGLMVLRGLLDEWFGQVTEWVFIGIKRLFDAIAVVWMIALIYAMFKIRFHYTVDIELVRCKRCNQLRTASTPQCLMLMWCVRDMISAGDFIGISCVHSSPALGFWSSVVVCGWPTATTNTGRNRTKARICDAYHSVSAAI